MDTKSLPVNRKDSIAVARLLDQLTESLELEVIGGFQGVGRPVFISDINRRLALSGYLEYFANDRIQILGNTEIHFMEKLSTSELQHRLEAMFAFEIPAFVLSRSLRPRNIFLDMCNRRGIPVLRSRRSTDEVISSIILFLAEEFSPETVIHGTAIDCYGVGILIAGAGDRQERDGAGTVERGHRMVADDVVTVRRGREGSYALASPSLSITWRSGVGIIDVKSVYGVGCVRTETHRPGG